MDKMMDPVEQHEFPGFWVNWSWWNDLFQPIAEFYWVWKLWKNNKFKLYTVLQSAFSFSLVINIHDRVSCDQSCDRRLSLSHVIFSMHQWYESYRCKVRMELVVKWSHKSLPVEQCFNSLKQFNSPVASYGEMSRS